MDGCATESRNDSWLLIAWTHLDNQDGWHREIVCTGRAPMPTAEEIDSAMTNTKHPNKPMLDVTVPSPSRPERDLSLPRNQ